MHELMQVPSTDVRAKGVGCVKPMTISCLQAIHCSALASDNPHLNKFDAPAALCWTMHEQLAD